MAAVRHGVARIDGEIEQGILELVGIGESLPQAARQHGLDVDGLAESATQQLGHAGDQAVDVQSGRFERLSAGESQQPMGELRRASTPLNRQIEWFHQRRGELARVLLETPPQRVEVACNDGQQIIEVMVNAPGKLADRFEFFACRSVASVSRRSFASASRRST